MRVSLQKKERDDLPPSGEATPSPPTEWDEANLRRIGEKIPWSVFLVAIAEMSERFTYRCLTGPLQNYIQNDRSDSLRPGALGRGQSTATALSYFFTCWCYAAPILGGIVADTYLGRYKTICLGSTIASLGILILFATSLPDSLDHGAGFPGLIVALIVIGLGFGGIKSNVGPLIAEQHAGRKPYVVMSKKAERVLVDPNITVQSIYNIYYWSINVGALAGIPATWLELKVGFWSTFLLATSFCCVAIIALVIGRNKYVVRKPQGSVVFNSFRAFIIGIKHRNLNAAKPSYQRDRGGSVTVPWDDRFIEELKRALVACKVFAVYPIYWVCYGQTNNNLTSQAATMNTHGTPNDMFQSFSPICIIIFLPIIQRLVYPGLQKARIPFKPIARITVGFLAATLCMGYATGLQYWIYSSGPCYDHPLQGECSNGGLIPNNVNAYAIIPAYFFAAMSEIFAYVTGLEYAFTKAPSSMKSLIIALYLICCSLGSLIGIALSPTSENPKVSVQFASLTGVMTLVTIGFYVIFSHFDSKEEELNAMEEDIVAKHRQEQNGVDAEASKTTLAATGKSEAKSVRSVDVPAVPQRKAEEVNEGVTTAPKPE